MASRVAPPRALAGGSESVAPAHCDVIWSQKTRSSPRRSAGGPRGAQLAGGAGVGASAASPAPCTLGAPAAPQYDHSDPISSLERFLACRGTERRQLGDACAKEGVAGR